MQYQHEYISIISFLNYSNIYNFNKNNEIYCKMSQMITLKTYVNVVHLYISYRYINDDTEFYFQLFMYICYGLNIL